MLGIQNAHKHPQHSHGTLGFNEKEMPLCFCCIGLARIRVPQNGNGGTLHGEQSDIEK